MRSRSQYILLVLCGLLAIALGALYVVNPLDGEPRSDFLQFVGRFHPVVLHLPIGFILLLAVLEFSSMSKRFESLKAAIPLVLTVSIISILGAVLTGFLLAYSSGSNESLVVEHMQTSILLAIGCVALGALKTSWDKPAAKIAYRVLLVSNLGLLASASHDGGSITHGSGYLTKHMPNAIRPIFGLEPTGPRFVESVDELIVYKDLVHPIIEQNCLSCHNPNKLKGELSLEDFAGFLKGGEDGPAIVVGDVDESVLIHRVTLPEDDEKFMPTDGKTPLTEEEIDLISWWIETGASEEATISSFEAIPASIELYATAVFDTMLTPEEIEKIEAKRVELYAKLKELNQELGIIVAPIEENASQFSLDTFSAQKSFDNQMLKKLEPFADTIVEADLSGTQLSDESIESLSKFDNLRSLNLSRTQIEGKTIGKLSEIETLESLNLYGTKLSSDRIDQLAQLTQLRRLYLFQTELGSESAVQQLREALPNCDFGLNSEAL